MGDWNKIKISWLQMNKYASVLLKLYDMCYNLMMSSYAIFQLKWNHNDEDGKEIKV